MDDLNDLNLHCTVSVDVLKGTNRAQKLCDRANGRPGLPSLIVPTVYVDVKQH